MRRRRPLTAEDIIARHDAQFRRVQRLGILILAALAAALLWLLLQ